MKLSVVQEVTKQMVAQTLGQTYMEQNGYLEAIPAEKLIDVGRDVTDADNTVEKATKALCVILAKRYIFEGEYITLFDDIMVDRVEWGGFIERDKLDLADIIDDPVFNVTNGSSYAQLEHTYFQPKVASKIYNEGKGICIPISIQRQTLTEAFNSWDSMNAFISKIHAKVRQTLDMALDRYCNALVNAGIAVSTKATKTAVYLLDTALADGVEGITAETTAKEAMANPNFLLHVAEKIAEIRDNMKMCTSVYNNGQWATSTKSDVLYLLTEYSRKLKFNVKRNVFNREDIDFGKYKSIPCWQAVKSDVGNPFAFEVASSISMSADPTNKLGIGVKAFEIDGVIGFLWNKWALGMTVFKEYTTTSYTASADFWNEFVHSVTNQLLDSDFPMVAFIVGRNPEAENVDDEV